MTRVFTGRKTCGVSIPSDSAFGPNDAVRTVDNANNPANFRIGRIESFRTSFGIKDSLPVYNFPHLLYTQSAHQ